MTQQRFWFKLISIGMLACLALSLAGAPGVNAISELQAPAAQTTSEQALVPQVIYPIKNDTSPALRTIQVAQRDALGAGEASPRLTTPKSEATQGETLQAPDGALQTAPAQANMPATGFNFEGVNNVNGVLPPDTNGDVSPNHYVQWVNLSMQIWEIDRATHSVTSVYGPTNGNAVWSGFGDECETANDGDPIVLYDHLADRWFISQFALPYFPNGPFFQCIAVSQTPDPTGVWYRYAFPWLNGNGDDVMNDYPHFGVWPDGYYLTVNQFAEGTTAWSGAGVAAYERDKMLLGQVARQVYFDLYNVNDVFGGMLPSDLDGEAPPAGAPNYFAEVDDSSWIGPDDAMRLWEFHVDWNNINNSTFGNNGNPNLVLPVAEFTPMSQGIPQPGTSVRLDNLADRLMHRLQYRNFGTHESLVTNHTVNAGNSRAGVRWYELRRSGGAWSIYQQGTYAGDGDNSEHRWMGSAAVDAAGNLSIGYSLSSGSVYPSIAYTGRLEGDPLNTLPQGEAVLINGSGSQTHSAARWGDYSMLSVDPFDECTFFFTSEYLQATSSASWQTRVGSYVFPSCLSGLKGSLAGFVSSGGSPVANATVEADQYSAQTDAAGYYEFTDLLVGFYTATVSAYGFQPMSVTDIEVVFNETTYQNFDLTAIPFTILDGTVTDGSGQGWPLYARLHISAPGYATTLFTDPKTGQYSINLAAGIEHSIDVSAVSPGYTSANAQVTPALVETTQDFALTADAIACSAPGYALVGSTCTPIPGGLVVGHVYDANTTLALNGAAVTSASVLTDTTTTVATPDDPLQADGMYILFSSLNGQQDFTASKASYGADTQPVGVVLGSTAEQDFNLPAGLLQAAPDSLVETVGATQTITRVIDLNNLGGLSADFSITEVNAATEELLPSGPFADATRHTSPKRLADLDARAVYEYVPPQIGALPGGGLLRSWASDLAHPWGIGVDTHSGDIWVGDLAAAGDDDRLHRFPLNGGFSPASIDVAADQVVFSADMVYNPLSRTFWQVNVSGGNCIVEINPRSLALTGKQICPTFDQSQRGLAFNPLNGSYYSGSWNNGILYHFGEDGMILDSANLNINIAGLAFNPSTRHLFVLSNASVGYDVYALDTENSYAVLGGFDIAGLGDFEQAGLSMDCNANLWVVNQISGRVYQVTSGEAAACAYAEIPWLTVTPLSGTIPAGADQALQVVINAIGLPAGHNLGSLAIASDTPYGTVTIPIDINVEEMHAVSVDPTNAAGEGQPGASVQYLLQIHNLGNVSDIYTITASGNDWTVSSVAQVGPVIVGGSASVNVTVMVPTSATPGDSDTVTLHIASLSEPATYVETHLTTSVPADAVYRLYMPSLSN